MLELELTKLEESISQINYKIWTIQNDIETTRVDFDNVLNLWERINDDNKNKQDYLNKLCSELDDLKENKQQRDLLLKNKKEIISRIFEEYKSIKDNMLSKQLAMRTILYSNVYLQLMVKLI